LVSLEIQFEANQRRFPEELHQALGLASPDNQLIELLDGHHDNAFLALPRDELRPFGSGLPEHFAKPRLGRLQLPRLAGCFQTAERFGHAISF
jgi:hypothetical protein